MTFSSSHLTYMAVVSVVGVMACTTPQRLALNKDPGNFQLYMELGNRAFEDRNWSLARRYFLRAHQEQWENADAVYRYAMTDLLEDKDLGRARRMLEQAVPAAGPADAPKLLDALARIAMREGRLADAKIALDEAQAAVSTDDSDLAGFLLETEGNLARAPQP